MLKLKREYRSFQVQVAPGVYGGFTLIGAFMFFVSGNWSITLISWLWIGVMCYLDKAFLFILFQRSVKLKLFILLVSLSLTAPVLAFHVFDSAFSEFVALLLVPIGGLSVAAFVYFVYTHTALKNEGWFEITGD